MQKLKLKKVKKKCNKDIIHLKKYEQSVFILKNMTVAVQTQTKVKKVSNQSKNFVPELHQDKVIQVQIIQTHKIILLNP